MRFAINLPNLGEYGDPSLLAELAREAEDAGWDGFFIWDHVQSFAPGEPVGARGSRTHVHRSLTGSTQVVRRRSV